MNGLSLGFTPIGMLFVSNQWKFFIDHIHSPRSVRPPQSNHYHRYPTHRITCEMVGKIRELYPNISKCMSYFYSSWNEYISHGRKRNIKSIQHTFFKGIMTWDMLVPRRVSTFPKELSRMWVYVTWMLWVRNSWNPALGFFCDYPWDEINLHEWLIEKRLNVRNK